MKKILGLSILLVIVLTAVTAGTWAYFIDTEDSTNNSFVAGTLDLGLANSSGVTPTGSTSQTWNLLASNGWKPGQPLSGTLYLYNGGSIPINSLTISFTYPSVIDGTPSTVHPIGTADTDKLDKMVKATTATFNGATATGIQGLTLEQLKAAGNINLTGPLGSHAEKALAITWTFDASATNGCQGDSVAVTVTVTGNQ
jgi:predicted ribosomally synthesized peptide with SipW-like signal peptide